MLSSRLPEWPCPRMSTSDAVGDSRLKPGRTCGSSSSRGSGRSGLPLALVGVVDRHAIVRGHVRHGSPSPKVPFYPPCMLPGPVCVWQGWQVPPRLEPAAQFHGAFPGARERVFLLSGVQQTRVCETSEVYCWRSAFHPFFPRHNSSLQTVPKTRLWSWHETMLVVKV